MLRVVIMVILLIYNYTKRYLDKWYTTRLPPVWEIAVHLAVAGDVYDGVFLCCLFFPRDVFDVTLDLIEGR